MRRSLALVVLLAGPALAALPRVALDAPLAPVASGLAAAPLASGAAAGTALLAGPSLGSLSLAPALSAAPAAALAAEAPRAEAAAAPAASAGEAPAAAPALLDRLLERVSLDDGNSAERGAALRGAFARMLESPTARALAERFVAEGPRAAVRFEAFDGSRVYEADGRRYFHGTRALTDWRDDRAVLRLNSDYLKSSAHYREQGLPAILAHELFGHGLWYARAARENLQRALHLHELNEENARLVGWRVDFELDGRFEEAAAWDYLANPRGYLDGQKMRLPYYAVTFSNQELARPLETLESRLDRARRYRAELEKERGNVGSWTPVVDHFASSHGVAEPRFRALRAHLADLLSTYDGDLRTTDEVIADLSGVISRLRAEPDRVSERYLQEAAPHPLFSDLAREADSHRAPLLEQVRASAASPADESAEARRRRAEHWSDQITFDELKRMYREDRQRHPHHWGP